MISNDSNFYNLMQWNMLSKSEQFCSQSSFPKVNEEDLKWENRAKVFKKIFEELNPDIICLQELDDYEDVKNNLLAAEKYNSEYFKKEEGIQGIGLFYSNQKFTLLHSDKVILPTDKFVKASNQFFCFAYLQDNSNKNVFCVLSTHLKAKSENEEIRFNQVKYILEFIDKNRNFLEFNENFNIKGLILCGDFNAEPSYSCIQYLLNYKFTTNPSLLNKSLISAYNFINSEKEDYLEMTTFKIRDTEYYRVIDYIFFTDGVKLIKNTPTIKKSDPSFANSELSVKGFPDKNLPSDHHYLNLRFSI